jgi:hypothetical protein
MNRPVKEQSGQVPAQEAGLHHAVVWATCPAGHMSGTQKASGSRMRCSRCWQDNRVETIVIVPDRDDPAAPIPAREPATPARPPARKPAKRGPIEQREQPPREHQCGGCRGVITFPAGVGFDRPRGWLSLSVRVPPELTPHGKGTRFVGQFCCVACLAASIPGLARAERAARADWPAEIPPPGVMPPRFDSSLTDLSRLMTEPANRSARR